jgi:DNA mismatch endonuclease (patch repair protein)
MRAGVQHYPNQRKAPEVEWYMDIWTPTKRSEVMSRISNRDTKPELIVRSLLHRSGVRFSLRRRDLPGKPDIVMPKYRAVVFVNGCFWHQHPNCSEASMPKTRTSFWRDKLCKNVARDRRNQIALRKQGWKVIVVWECQVLKDPLAVLRRILITIRPNSIATDYSLPDRGRLFREAEQRLQRNLLHRLGS